MTAVRILYLMETLFRRSRTGCSRKERIHMNTVQSMEGYQTLLVLMDLFEQHGGELTLVQLEEDLDAMGAQAPSKEEACAVLQAYSSDTIAAPEDGSQVLCLFQNLSEGTYALLADEQTVQALRQKRDSFVAAEDLSAATAPYEGETAEDTAYETARIGLYDEPHYEAADDPARRMQAVRPDGHHDYSVYTQNAEMALRQPSDRTMASIDMMPEDTASLLDDANAAIVQARDRADAAEAHAEVLQKEVDDLRRENEALGAAAGRKQAKTQKKIAKAQDRIEQQQRKIDDHNEQIERNSSGMMQSLHKAQIRHDKKVIDRKERKLDRLHQK